MDTASSICDLNDDILALIVGAIDDEHVYGRPFNRPSVLAFSETCKHIRTVAAPIIFNKLVIWDWDSFCETARMMQACEHVRRFTRTLRVTPIIERILPPSDEKYITFGLRATRFDLSLPKAGRFHTNSHLHYGTRAPGVPEPETAYMPLSSLEDGPNNCVDEHALALINLLVNFNNLTGLVFGIGTGYSSRPPFENSLISAFRVGKPDAILLSNVTRLDIEDTGMFWAVVCPSLRDLTLRLGYSTGAEVDCWPTVESVRSVRVSGTIHCELSRQDAHLSVRRPAKREYACGPALTKAFPNITSLELMDCQSELEPLLTSIKDFALVQHLHVCASVSSLGLGLERPPRRCGTGEMMRWQGMNDEQRAAELENRKRESKRRNAAKQAALNLGKRIVMSKFPRLQSFKIGDKISYDFTQLQSRKDLGELDRLMMAAGVSLDQVY